MHESKGRKCLTKIYLLFSPKGRVGAAFARDVGDTRINLSRFQNILPAFSIIHFLPLDLDHPGGIIALDMHRIGKKCLFFSLFFEAQPCFNQYAGVLYQ